MRSQHSETTKADAEALWKLLGSPEWKLFEIAEVIQAAEERGRRAGIEEAQRVAASMRDDDVGVCLVCGADASNGVLDCNDNCFRVRLVKALAPRDSGKEQT